MATKMIWRGVVLCSTEDPDTGQLCIPNEVLDSASVNLSTLMVGIKERIDRLVYHEWPYGLDLSVCPGVSHQILFTIIIERNEGGVNG